jgi:hypothetical protein
MGFTVIRSLNLLAAKSAMRELKQGLVKEIGAYGRRYVAWVADTVFPRYEENWQSHFAWRESYLATFSSYRINTDDFTNVSYQDDDLTSAYEDQTLSNLRMRLRNLSSDFNARIVVLLGDLTYQPDADLRLLGVLLSFNEFYPMVHKKSRRDREAEGTVRRNAPRTVSKQHDKGKEREQTEDTMSTAGQSMAPPPTVTESGGYSDCSRR